MGTSKLKETYKNRNFTRKGLFKVDNMEKYENFKIGREKTILNSWQILKLAVFLFEKNIYNISCFLAMTSIEETGKLMALRQLDMFEISPFSLDSINPKSRNKFFRNHRKKALIATGAVLYSNFEADKRHGDDPQSKIHRTAGVFLLGLSHKWMEIRNQCIYTDINFASKNSFNPRDSISREHAYYFICMAFEVLCSNSIFEFNSKVFSSDNFESVKVLGDFMAELISIDFEKYDENLMKKTSKGWKNHADPDMLPEEFLEVFSSYYKNLVDCGMDNLIDEKAINFRNNRLSDLERFMEKWLKTIDLSELDFLNNPDPLLKIVKDNEGTDNLTECLAKYLTPFEAINNKSMTKEELADLWRNVS